MSAEDARLLNPLICGPTDGLGRFPRDTLRRTAANLDLLAALIEGLGAEKVDFFESQGQRAALAIQLSGSAALLEALADALVIHKPALHPGEIPIFLDADELAKLEKIACRRGCSVIEAAQSILASSLSNFRPDKPRAKS